MTSNYDFMLDDDSKDITLESKTKMKPQKSGWQSKHQLEEYFDRFANDFQGILGFKSEPGMKKSTITIDEFGDKYFSNDFEEHMVNSITKGLDAWKENFKNNACPVLKGLKCWIPSYEIDLWQERQAFISFVYFYQFSDGRKTTSKGSFAMVWDCNGKVSRIIYFDKSSSIEQLTNYFINDSNKIQ